MKANLIGCSAATSSRDSFFRIMNIFTHRKISIHNQRKMHTFHDSRREGSLHKRPAIKSLNSSENPSTGRTGSKAGNDVRTTKRHEILNRTRQGIDSPIVNTRCYIPHMIISQRLSNVSAKKGGEPVAISYKTHPNAHKSEAVE